MCAIFMILMRIIVNEALSLKSQLYIHCGKIVAELQIFNVTPSSGWGENNVFH